MKGTRMWEREMREQAWRERETRPRSRQHRKRKRDLQRKIFGFCLFTFLLGVLCGKIVFAKEDGLLARVQKDGAGAETEFLDGGLEDGTVKADALSHGGEDALSDAVDKDDWRLTLVNADHPVKNGYEPELAEIENNYYFDARAVGYLQQMLADGRKEGLDFWVCSAYRTIEKQTALYENKVRRLKAEGMTETAARAEAATVVAYPGTSEHNLGLAVDIVARDYQMLDEKQEQTEEQQWLMENCWKYGFILRYPTGKSAETGIIYEPWHYRYVGREAAREITEQGVCLEEYLGEA